MKRIFIGIEFDDETRKAMVSVQAKLEESITRQGVRFVNPEKIHLTILFIGNAGEEEIPSIDEKFSELCREIPPLNLTIRNVGAFPNIFRPRVLWLGVEGDVAPLEKVRSTFADYLGAFSKHGEEKLAPHITLARISPGSKEVGRIVTELAIPDDVIATVQVSHISLIESKPNGSYETLHRWALGG